MYLERLELHDFRSYRTAALDLPRGVAVFVGANAQGKTNLLEAVHYLGVGSSHRVASDLPLVRSGADAAVVRARARLTGGGDRLVTVEVEMRPAGRNRARLNGQPQPRVRDVIGVVRAVLFAPEDVMLVRGDPSDRRRFLDDLLVQRRPAYYAARQDYDRVLRQRNTLLRSMRGTRSRHATSGPPPAGAVDELATWTESLVVAGALVLAARLAVLHALAAPAEQAYRDLATDAPGGKADASLALAYRLSTGRTIPARAGAGVPDPGPLADELRAALAQRHEEERERALTLVGPHRDDLLLGVGDLPAKGFASHGEQWSLALALRLGSREVLCEVGDEPVILLDDVFAELDDRRRGALARRCTDFEQVLVTAAVDADVPLAGPRYHVRGGTVATAAPDSAAGA